MKSFLIVGICALLAYPTWSLPESEHYKYFLGWVKPIFGGIVAIYKYNQYEHHYHGLRPREKLLLMVYGVLGTITKIKRIKIRTWHREL